MKFLELKNVAVNKLAQKLKPNAKIFFIGPHRCATTTFHQFFANQGLKSLHWRTGDIFLAKEIDLRKNDPQALKKFLNGWTVYSDFVYLTDSEHIENHTLYKTFAELYPEAYFIFNDRNVDRWINSRILHRNGGWVTRYLKVHGCSLDEAKEQWKSQFLTHRDDVLKYFKHHGNFIHIYIDKQEIGSFVDQTEIAAMVKMLNNDYSLSAAHWKNHNTKRRAEIVLRERQKSGADESK
jgi:hypothetical protein